MIDVIWDVFSELLDVRIGRALFGSSYRAPGSKTPTHQLVSSGLLSLLVVALIAGSIVWVVIKLLSGH